MEGAVGEGEQGSSGLCPGLSDEASGMLQALRCEQCMLEEACWEHLKMNPPLHEHGTLQEPRNFRS